MKRLILFLALSFSIHSSAQELLDYSFSSCSERSYPEFIRRRIISSERKEDTLIIRLGLVLNCCISPELELSKSSDSLFVQVNNSGDIICACECCFEMEMELTGIKEDSLRIFMMKEDPDSFDENFNFDYYPVEFKQSPNKYIFPTSSELKTFENFDGEWNQLTPDSLKVGLWKRKGENHNYIAMYVIDENGKSQWDWWAAYTFDGELESISGKDGMGESSVANAREYYRLFEVKEENKE